MTTRSASGAAQPREESPVQGYYDASLTGPAIYVLERAKDRSGRDLAGTYLLKQRISYVSRDGHCWTVPADEGQEFCTDLASIPSFASWLVPKDGSHTPAALIHDAMVLDGDETPSYSPADPVVEREEADRLFREGMQHLGVRLLRRWLMWTAVSIPTFFSPPGHYWVRRLMLVPLGIFMIIGLFGVPDVLDVPGAITFPDWIPGLRGRILAWQLHGVDESSFLVELCRFVLIAATGSVLYALLWVGSRWRFGLISGLGLSLLTVAMVIPFVTYLIYRALEELIALVLLIRKEHGRETGRVRSAQWVETLASKL
jgi:hypothetical protein